MVVALTFRVLDNLGVIGLHDGAARVRGTEIDSDNPTKRERQR